MRVCNLFIALMGLTLYAGEAVQTVKDGSLWAGADVRIGLIFDHYKWFEATSWDEPATKDGKAVVRFTGVIDDAAAVKAFDEENKYRFSFAFKAMQLEPAYGLTKNKEKLAYRLYFKFSNKRSFDLVRGELGVLEKGEWRYTELSEKALEMVVAGIYANEQPYNSLVKGLPYR